MGTLSPAAQAVDWGAIAPPVVVAITAIVVLLAGMRRHPSARTASRVTRGISVAGLAIAALLLVPLRAADRATFCLPTGCSYVVDSTALVFQLIAIGGAVVVLLLSAPIIRPAPSTGFSLQGREIGGEYAFLVLCSVAGAMTLAAARDLITVAVALELVTLPAIGLVGLRRKENADAAEAALKFFLVSVVSVAVMLFGISLVYGAAGTLQLHAIATQYPAGGGVSKIAAVGVILTVVGLAFKVAAVPFHFWVPDTYVGAPIPVAAYLSVVSKSAGIAGLLIVLGAGFPAYTAIWTPIIGVLAAITMTVGNLVALRQTDAVRLLAWSSVSQAGFTIVPLGSADRGVDVLGASVAYLILYAVVNLGAFTVVSLVGGGSLERFRGLFRTDRWLALAMAFFMLALAGLPPAIIGLFGKIVVVQAAVRGGATWLAIVAAVNVAIGLAYYLRWTALLFARPEPEPEQPATTTAGRPETPVPQGTSASLGGYVALGVTATLAVVLSVVPGLAVAASSLLPHP